MSETKIEAVDIKIETPFQGEGVAYYRLPKEVKEFLELCHQKQQIAGFEWDPENPWDFGIILKNPRKDEANTSQASC